MVSDDVVPSPVASKEMKDYFSLLESEADKCYILAGQARRRGIDPSLEPEMPRAKDLASRVEKQLEDYGVEGVASLIRDLSKEHNREEVALLVAKEFARRHSDSPEASLEKAVRLGLSVLTEGILVAPLEGIVGVKIGNNDDGTDYAAVYFAGPIRSAGGTGQAMSVLICDVVRRELGIGAYKPTEQEVERFKEEIPIYKQSQHLQYVPSSGEIEIVVKNCPVSIDGEGTEDAEVSGFRNLPRVPTNKVRGGACLVIAEGMVLKASKLKKHAEKLSLSEWRFLDSLSGGKEEQKEESDEVEEDGDAPVAKYIKEIVAGRPVLSHPSRKGGFRLRYGRARTTGMAATALNPASMVVFMDLIAVGTQIKMELPGKAGAVTPCTTIEGPLVLLDNGDFVRIDTMEVANANKNCVDEIVDVGEILIPFGEFLENNHALLPGAYDVERWSLEAEDAGLKPQENISAEDAFSISEEYDIPLHPDYNLFWHDLSGNEIEELSNMVEERGVMKDGLILPIDASRLLQELGCTYLRMEEGLLVEHYSISLLRCLGLKNEDGKIVRTREIPENMYGCSLATHLSGVTIMPRAPTRIGARMGRPEKAKERKMKPPVHCLFPVGSEIGPQRLLKDAAARDTIRAEVGKRECQRCGKETYMCLCSCGGHTVPSPEGGNVNYSIPIMDMLNQALKTLCLSNTQGAKGVQGLMSSFKVPEALEKGILRAKHQVFVFKDGTCRFDLTDLPLTHFKPREIGLTVEDCKRLGYTKDHDGQELANGEQIVEIKPQDVVLAKDAGEYLVKVAGFVDEELQKVYGLEPFYNVKDPSDLVGHMLVGLAPHTSGGVLARLIGFSKASVGYAHPFFHAAKRRNCDGDEDCVMMLMDGLLNFSKQFLPKTRGGLMDAPLVLTTRIDPMEIDKEAQNIDISWKYPLDFYVMADKGLSASEVKSIITVKSVVKTPEQYEGFGFTHDTYDISGGVIVSAYKTLETMEIKLNAQLALARKIRAVDENDTASRIITQHFLPDIIGNMRKFCTQKFRCTKCNTKYRRVPLACSCTKERGAAYFTGDGSNLCGGNLVLTVSEKSVIKYLEVCKRMANEYELSSYTQQRIEILEDSLASLFNTSKTKACSLQDFF